MTSTSSTSRRPDGVKGDLKATLIAIRGFREGWPTIKRQVRYQFGTLAAFALAGHFLHRFHEIDYLILLGIQILGIYGEMVNSANEVGVDNYVEHKHDGDRNHDDEGARMHKDLSSGAMTPIAVGGFLIATILLIWPL